MGAEATDHEGPGSAKAGGPARASAARRAGSGGAKRPMTSDALRVLERTNRELLQRVRELESRRDDGTEPGEGNGQGERAPGENGDILGAIKGLHGEIDSAFVLKRAMESDLLSAQTELAEERALRLQLEARVSQLEAKAVFADQLREDISFVEEEQNKTCRRLREVTAELERITEERDRLGRAKGLAEGRVKELQAERFGLEAQVVDLKDRLEDMVMLFTEKRSSPA